MYNSTAFGTPQNYYGDPNIINQQNGMYYPAWNVNQYVNPQADMNRQAPTSSITTPDEAQLLNQMHGVSYEVTPEKMAEKLCDHKNGHTYLAQVNPDTGWMYCPRCKKTFKIMAKGEDIQKYVDTIDTAFETIKLLNTGLPVEAIRRLGAAVATIDQTMKPIYESVYDGWDRLNNVAVSPIPVYNNNGYIGNTAEALNNLRTMPSMAYQPMGVVPPYQTAPMVPPTAPIVGNPWDNGGIPVNQQVAPQYAPMTPPYTPVQQSNVYNPGIAPQSVAGIPGTTVPQAAAPVTNITSNPVIPGATAPQAPAVPVQPGASGPALAPQPPVAPAAN